MIPADSAAKAAATPRLAGGDRRGNGGVYVGIPVAPHRKCNGQVRLGYHGCQFPEITGFPFIYVLFDGRLGEIFVPYHEGSPRYEDIGYESFNWHPLTLTPAQFPAPREIIGDGKICKEKRDYLAWMERAINPMVI